MGTCVAERVHQAQRARAHARCPATHLERLRVLVLDQRLGARPVRLLCRGVVLFVLVKHDGAGPSVVVCARTSGGQAPPSSRPRPARSHRASSARAPWGHPLPRQRRLPPSRHRLAHPPPRQSRPPRLRPPTPARAPGGCALGRSRDGVAQRHTPRPAPRSLTARGQCSCQTRRTAKRPWRRAFVAAAAPPRPPLLQVPASPAVAGAVTSCSSPPPCTPPTRGQLWGARAMRG